MTQDTSDSQENYPSASIPPRTHDQATLPQEFLLAQASEPGTVLSYERPLEKGGKMLLDAFVYKDRAWLYYWQVDEDDSYNDVGFRSYDPSFPGPDDPLLPYTLDNGQVDWYPRSWTIPVDEALHAVEYFLSGKGEMTPHVAWCDW